MDKNEMKEYFNHLAKDRDKWMNKNKYFYQLLKKYFKFLVPDGASVLEIGCGTGELLNAVNPSRGVGIDFSPAMIKIAKSKFPHLEFKIEDAEYLKSNEKFDYVILSYLIGSLLDVQKVFDQLKKVSTPNTRVIIAYYNYLWEPILRILEKIKLKMPQPLQNWLSLLDIENLLYLSDFEVIEKGCKILLPKYIPVISSFFNRFLANLPFFTKLCLTEIVIARLRPNTNNSDVNKDYSCSIIIACRNERENIRPLIERIPYLGKHTELIFVEGHSNDGTLDEIKKQIKEFPEKDIKVFVQDGIGKGNAVRNGLAHAKGDILMIFDADLTVAPEELPKFYDVLVKGKGELVMGSRLIYPREEGTMRFLNLIGNKFFSIVFTYLLGQRIKDTLCANKALFKRDYMKINATLNFFGNFDPFGDFDFILGASRHNLKIVEIPVRYIARSYGTTQIRRFNDGWLLLKICWLALRKIKFQ